MIQSLLHAFTSRFEGFQPYIKDLPIRACQCRFFYGTPQAAEWYDPLKPHARAEYEWLLQNVDLRHQRIIDGGAHHGQYTAVFCVGSEHTSKVISVDPVSSNCAIIEVNLAINDAKATIEQCAISNIEGSVLFSRGSNGRILRRGGIPTPSKRLPCIMRDATIVKLDIEGAEFVVLPDQVDEMSSVHTWIVEIHPSAGKDPSVLVDLFRRRGFELFWVNKDGAFVEPYPDPSSWETHGTLFALRK